MVNEKKSPAFLAYRSFHTPVNTIKQFCDAGYDTICVFPAHTRNSRGTPYSQYEPTWLWYDRIDFSPFDKMIHDIDKAMPDAKILCMIDLNAPCWLEHMDGTGASDTFNNLGKAIHSEEWVQATQTYLKGFIEYANKHYGNRITAYILACGATDEWYDYSNGSDHPVRIEAWRKWQMSHGKPDPIDIPPQSIRNNASHENLLRDPNKDGIAIDYWHFCNESVADTILKFASIAKEIVGNKAQVGCFYGYILEKTETTLVSCGHLEYEKVLDSPCIDFLISPGTYVDRQIGEGSGFLIPAGTARVRGKRLLHECDQRTHTSNNFLTPDIVLHLNSAWKNEKSTVAGLKREASLGLMNGTNLWWFDMWGDFYQGETVMKTLADIASIWKETNIPLEAAAGEIAMIVDPESTYMLNQDHSIIPEIHRGTRNKLSRVGAPYDIYSFNDIPKIKNFEQYKLIVFSSPYHMTEDKKNILEKYVFCNDRYVLWMYAPGIYSNGVFSTANCEKLSGIPYGTSGLEIKKMNGWTSCYIYDYNELTPAILKELARDSGVCVTTVKEIPVYAGKDMIAIHTSEGGKLELCVDNKYHSCIELFTKNEYKIVDGKFTYSFSAPDTALFKLLL